MVSTTACERPLKSAASRPGATHGGSTDLDAGAKWCQAPEKGGPSSEECTREGLSRGEWVRETRSGWARTARPAGPAPRPPWPCTVSVRAGSLGELHTCIEPEASCASASVPRGPSVRENTAGSGRTRGKQTGLPELPRIDSRSAGSSRDGVAILRGSELSWERIGRTIELPRNVDSAQRFEPRVTPEEEMAGELWHAAWLYTAHPVDVRHSRSVVRTDQHMLA